MKFIQLELFISRYNLIISRRRWLFSNNVSCLPRLGRRRRSCRTVFSIFRNCRSHWLLSTTICIPSCCIPLMLLLSL
jgi:hypothetical protein